MQRDLHKRKQLFLTFFIPQKNPTNISAGFFEARKSGVLLELRRKREKNPPFGFGGLGLAHLAFLNILPL